MTNLSIPALRQTCANCSLANLCLPVGLDQEDLKLLDNLVAKRRVLNKGEHVFDVGHPFDRLFTVRSGAFKTTVLNADGKQDIVGFYLPGELFGFDGISERKHQVTAQAIKTSSICEIPFEPLLRATGRIPDLLRQLFSLISEQTLPEAAIRLNHTAQQRLAAFLLSLSKRFKQCGYSETEFNLPMSREEIANYLGLAPETISRLLTHLYAEGILSINRRHIILNDLEQLQTIHCSGH